MSIAGLSKRLVIITLFILQISLERFMFLRNTPNKATCMCSAFVLTNKMAVQFVAFNKIRSRCRSPEEANHFKINNLATSLQCLRSFCPQRQESIPSLKSLRLAATHLSSTLFLHFSSLQQNMRFNGCLMLFTRYFAHHRVIRFFFQGPGNQCALWLPTFLPSPPAVLSGLLVS